MKHPLPTTLQQRLQTATSDQRTATLRRASRAAFTIIELLTVVSIIAILLGMIGTASYAARQKAYRAQASAEVREIANACRSYWIASANWKNGSRWPGSNDGSLYNNLLGKDQDNTYHAVFLQFDEQRIENGQFLDPWGNPYRVSGGDTDVHRTTHIFSASVSFPMRNRYEYYGKQFK